MWKVFVSLCLVSFGKGRLDLVIVILEDSVWIRYFVFVFVILEIVRDCGGFTNFEILFTSCK